MPHTVRLAVPMEGTTTYADFVYGEITFENRLIDDQVLLKSNGWPTYHLAVVVDDHTNGITHVIRGEDWQPSTPKQILLYQAFGWEQPVWVHCPLIIGKDRKKLSKRHGSTKFVEFLDEGYLPEAMFNFLVLCGWSPGEENREIFSREEIVERFSLEGIGKSPAIFDYEKLRWMNGEYIRALSFEELASRCLPFMQKAGLVGDPVSQEERAYVEKLMPLVAERLKVLSEVAPSVQYFFREPLEADEKGRRKWLSGPDASARLQKAVEVLSRSSEFTEEVVSAAVDRIAEELGIERGPVIHTLRIAVTGRTVGPGLFELLSVLGQDRVINRLNRALSWVDP
jgi:glutamyl-tRNA synthetase